MSVSVRSLLLSYTEWHCAKSPNSFANVLQMNSAFGVSSGHLSAQSLGTVNESYVCAYLVQLCQCQSVANCCHVEWY